MSPAQLAFGYGLAVGMLAGWLLLGLVALLRRRFKGAA